MQIIRTFLFFIPRYNPSSHSYDGSLGMSGESNYYNCKSYKHYKKQTRTSGQWYNQFFKSLLKIFPLSAYHEHPSQETIIMTTKPSMKGVSKGKNTIAFAIAMMINFIAHLHGATLVIDPSQNMRMLHTEYEKSTAFIYGQIIRDFFYNHEDNHFSTILTRTPGETLEPLQAATFSNTLAPDMHCSFHFFAAKEPHIYIYYFLPNAHEKQLNFKKNKLTLIPARNAYIYEVTKTQELTSATFDFLKQRCTNYAQVHAPIGCPFKPLCGITSPSFSLEIGIPEKHDHRMLQSILIELFEHLAPTLTSEEEQV